MTPYQVIARRYRPKRFKEVVGQEAIVTTILNAIKMNRVGHAYLFSGSRGTGKTTLARLFAKALNCKALSNDFEPCLKCTSCQEISSSSSLDVIEIDGASHRGIEDIRQINETALYLPTGGKYKIYLIDEVHMLTKEAFNALLKSLEEPAPQVKFFFATTEAHKIPATILSRCQHFYLKRLSLQEIQRKLSLIAKDLNVEVEEAALNLVALVAEGGLRDAESLLDQLITCYGEKLYEENVRDLLGLFPKEIFKTLDEAALKGETSFAFELANKALMSGKSLPFFIEELIEHYRGHLLKKTPSHYKEEQLFEILELLSKGEAEIKNAFSEKTALEMLLLKILRLSKKSRLEILVDRLIELEGRLEAKGVETLKEVPIVEQKESLLQPQIAEVKKETPQVENEKLPFIKQKTDKRGDVAQKAKLDTLIRFAAKELDGSLKQKEQ